MGLLDGILGKLDVVISNIDFNNESKKPCTSEEKERMIEIINGYQVVENEKGDRPLDFGSVLRVGDEMKKILVQKKVNPTCYLEPVVEEENEKGTVGKNEECFKDEDCVENLVCSGYIKDLTPGTCLDPKHDVIDISKIIAFGNVCEDQRDCSIRTRCSSKQSTFTTSKKCMSINFPLKDQDGNFIEKIILYDLI